MSTQGLTSALGWRRCRGRCRPVRASTRCVRASTRRPRPTATALTPISRPASCKDSDSVTALTHPPARPSTRPAARPATIPVRRCARAVAGWRTSSCIMTHVLFTVDRANVIDNIERGRQREATKYLNYINNMQLLPPSLPLGRGRWVTHYVSTGRTRARLHNDLQRVC